LCHFSSYLNNPLGIGCEGTNPGRRPEIYAFSTSPNRNYQIPIRVAMIVCVCDAGHKQIKRFTSKESAKFET
jgi:hypothetical protein